MTRAQYLATPMPERLKGDALHQECQSIIKSWGLKDTNFILHGNIATVSHPGGVFKCMRWDLTQRLNELALETLKF